MSSAFDWDAARRARELELSSVPAPERARRLVGALHDVGCLEGQPESEAVTYALEELERRGSLEAHVVLRHFKEGVAFDIEGDFYEPGSYARIFTTLFGITRGRAAVSEVADEVSFDRVTLRFSLAGEALSASVEPEPPADGFDTRLVARVNGLLAQRGVSGRFQAYYPAESDQILHYAFVEEDGKRELQERGLVIFDPKLCYQPQALRFLW